MYLLDTNHCSQILFGNQRIEARLREIDLSIVTTSVIVRGEMQFMAWNSQKPSETLNLVDAFLRRLTAYHVDYAVARIYAFLKASIFKRFAPKEQAKRRRTALHHLGFDENDLWIAATAIRFDLIVVSSDSDFARIAEVTALRHESWLTGDPAT